MKHTQSNAKHLLHHGIGIVLLMLTTNFAQAEKLSLDHFIQTVLSNNPGVKQIMLQNDIAAAQKHSSEAIDDGYIASSLNASHAEPDKIYGNEPAKTDGIDLSLAYNRIFSNTGTRMSVAYQSKYTAANPATPSAGANYYQPSITLKITQPLLKNAGGIQDRVNRDIAVLNHDLTRLNSKEKLESYITQLTGLYIDWYLAYQEMKISENVYQQSIAQLKLTREKVRRQVSEPYEGLRAEESREDYYSRLQQAKGRFAGLQYQIHYQMNPSSDNINNKLIPQDPGTATIFKQQQQRDIDYLARESRLKNILDILEKQQLVLISAKSNGLRSSLDLSVGYTRHGIDNTLVDAQSSSFDKNNYFVMLEYSMPIGNKKASGEYQSALAKKRQVQYDSQQQLLNAKSAFNNIKVQIEKIQLSIQSLDRKITIARKKIKKENYLYKIGKLDLFELLRDQSSLLESRLNREKLYAQLLNLKNQLGELVDNNLASLTQYEVSEK